MDKSQLPKLQRTVRHVVQNASEAGGAIDSGGFTFATARAEVTRIMGFDKGTLDGQWKKVVKEEVNKALESLKEAEEGGEASSSNSVAPATSPKKKAVKPAPKPRSKPPIPKPQPKSEAIMQHDSDSGLSALHTSPERTRTSPRRAKQSPATKPRKPSKSPDDDEDSLVEDGNSSEEDKPKSGGRKKASIQERLAKQTKGRKRSRSPIEDVDAGEDEDSDMSIVYDPSPKRRKRKSDPDGSKAKKVASDVKKSRSKAKKDPNEGLSPDEAKVADLKRIVTACGTRKQWAKEFQDAPSSRAQIKILQQMLKDLGMDGRPTLPKAKSIKEARELAAELNDVREFEAARGMSAAERPRRSQKVAYKAASSDEYEGEPEEKGAADAVMAFLQDEDSN